MKDATVVIAYGATVVGCVAIGAYLALQGHPWFGLLAMLIGGSLRVKTSDREHQQHRRADGNKSV